MTFLNCISGIAMNLLVGLSAPSPEYKTPEDIVQEVKANLPEIVLEQEQRLGINHRDLPRDVECYLPEEDRWAEFQSGIIYLNCEVLARYPAFIKSVVDHELAHSYYYYLRKDLGLEFLTLADIITLRFVEEGTGEYFRKEIDGNAVLTAEEEMNIENSFWYGESYWTVKPFLDEYGPERGMLNLLLEALNIYPQEDEKDE